MGTLNIKGNVSCTDVLISSKPATHDSSIPYAGSDINLSSTTDLLQYKTIIGAATIEGVWNNIISVRHRNGSGDGGNYGMYIRTSLTSTDHLRWSQQCAGTWTAERTILDNNNYTNYCTPANIGAAATSHNHWGDSLWPAAIELGRSGTGNYIDFHYSGTDADYTSRIIEVGSGVISVNGTFFGKANSDITIAGPVYIPNGTMYGTSFPSSASEHRLFFKLI